MGSVKNPENVPERLNEFLSLLLGQKVRIESVLPNDSSRIADESSLLIMDILVRLEDGSLCNVEVQKIGYRFPGERSACYSADLLLRQYKRIRGSDKHKNAYKNMKNVYTVILFEKSPVEFKQFPEAYLHQFSQKSDTGLEINLLQKYLFIPLDIFLRNIHNKGIRNKLDGWLVFFSDDSPERIIELLGKYPEFKPLYEHVYEMCRNVEKVMEMYSKELLEMDRNTVQYMIDEMQEEINQKDEELNQKDVQLSQKDAQLKQINAQLEQERRQYQETLEKMQRQLQELQEK
ncbi:MAG: PD-(D/E)XK nuclease family transposase [Eubacteriales bacterium]|nr:PD-(D/E)XK nuclease family transposase [Eubacteriales bacterium]